MVIKIRISNTRIVIIWHSVHSAISRFVVMEVVLNIINIKKMGIVMIIRVVSTTRSDIGINTPIAIIATMILMILTNPAWKSSSISPMPSPPLIKKSYSNYTNLPSRQFSSICLLYTSPSPRDLSTSRMPSSA